MTTLSKLQCRGFTLQISGDKLVVTPASKLDTEERKAIKRDRREIIKQLKKAQLFNLTTAHSRHPVAPLEIAEELTPTERTALPGMDPERQRLTVQSAALRVHSQQLRKSPPAPHTDIARCFECTHRYTAGDRYQCRQRPDVELWHPRGGIECEQWQPILPAD